MRLSATFFTLFISLSLYAHDIEVLVHRGANHLAPENTIESAFAALDNGASWIELDVRQSKDGVLYNLHDDTLDRTTDGHGSIGRWLSSDIDRLDAGSWFSQRYAGIHVPTIEAMLDTLQGRANIFFDVKDGVSLPHLIDMVRAKGWTDKSFFWFGNRKMQDEFCHLAPEMKIKVNAESMEELLAWTQVCTPMAIEISAPNLTSEIKDYCHSHGIKIMAALMQKNGDIAYREAIACQPDMVNLDQPERFVQVVRQIDFENDPKIAVLADPHIMDISTYPELLRSMTVQIQSTRLFNENIYAFRAALDDVAQRGIKLAIIAGDITDDGQVVNQEAARRIMEEYESKYGIAFFITPGNHDPKTPFGQAMKGTDFLRPDGSLMTIVSDSTLYKEGAKVRPDMRSVGHDEQIKCYARYGEMPRPDYLYWATPFSTYGYADYSFIRAEEEADTQHRTYSYAGGINDTDMSYVAEPVDGVWILSLDSGVYLPDGKGGYANAGAGYSNTLEHKPYLVEWVKTIASEAHRLGKQLVTFSHYPLLDCNDDATPILSRLWGKDKFDISRMPSDSVATIFADAGMEIHFGGHMHINDVAELTTPAGNHIVNIQVPSLASAIPAYKIMSLSPERKVTTAVVVDAPGFDTFFDTYRQEYQRILDSGEQPLWSTELLDTKNYAEFCDWQFRDLTRVRFANNDVPKILQEQFLSRNGEEIYQMVVPQNCSAEGMQQWTGLDLLLDIFRLHCSGSLAHLLIPAKRHSDYQHLFRAIDSSTDQSMFMLQLRALAAIYRCFDNGEPDVIYELTKSPNN